ncbi:MAG: amidohydrolase family protein, partial [Peptoniphilaceae bacterium]
MSLLLKNLSYLNIEEEKIYENYDIYIQDNIIKQIGKDLKLEAEEIINCDNKLALPAFTNAHSHLGMTMMRNLADDLDLDTWLNKKIFPIEDKLSEEDIYYASLLSIIENIKSGVSSVCDMYYSLDKVSEAIIESGVRGFLSRGLMDIAGGGKERLDELKWLYSTYHNAGNRVKIIPGPHSIYTCSKEYLKEILELSKDMDGVLNIHLSETLKEVKDSIKNFGLSPAYYLDSIGYFDVKLIAAHCTHLSNLEIDFVSDKDFYPIYNPTSNLKLASGFTNVQKMLDKN